MEEEQQAEARFAEAQRAIVDNKEKMEKLTSVEKTVQESLKELEQENTRLKRLLADAELDKAMLKELAEGNF